MLEEKIDAQRIEHPAWTLEREFMEPLYINAHRLALLLGVSPSTITLLIRQRRGISAEMALRLERLFGTSASAWLRLQSEYELQLAREKFGEIVRDQIRPLPPSAIAELNHSLPMAGDETQDTPKKGRDDVDLASLEPDERAVWDLLTDQPKHFDILAYRGSFSAGALSAALTTLEVKNLVRRQPGDFYSRR